MAKKVSLITGQELREMFAAATAWLEKSASDIDDLNVFPVPDGPEKSMFTPFPNECFRLKPHSVYTASWLRI